MLKHSYDRTRILTALKEAIEYDDTRTVSEIIKANQEIVHFFKDDFNFFFYVKSSRMALTLITLINDRALVKKLLSDFDSKLSNPIVLAIKNGNTDLFLTYLQVFNIQKEAEKLLEILTKDNNEGLTGLDYSTVAPYEIFTTILKIFENNKELIFDAIFSPRPRLRTFDLLLITDQELKIKFLFDYFKDIMPLKLAVEILGQYYKMGNVFHLTASNPKIFDLIAEELIKYDFHSFLINYLNELNDEQLTPLKLYGQFSDTFKSLLRTAILGLTSHDFNLIYKLLANHIDDNEIVRIVLEAVSDNPDMGKDFLRKLLTFKKDGNTLLGLAYESNQVTYLFLKATLIDLEKD